MTFLTPKLKNIVYAIALVACTNVYSQNQDINVPESGNVGSVIINTQTPIVFTIQNTHTGGLAANNQLNVSNITVTGTNSSEFVVSGISLPSTIIRNNSTTFIVTFTPTASGNRTATMNIASDDPDENPYQVNLVGFGDAALTTLTLLSTYALTVPEPSGLAYDSNTNQLFTVSDNTGLVYKISTTGNLLGTLNYSGSDLEGVSMYTSNKILIAVEGTRHLVEYDYVVDNGTFTTHAMATTSPIDGGASNSGIEGVTYDAINDEIYFLIEKNNGGLLTANSSFVITNQYEDPLAHAGDYSGSCYVPETGKLWLASDKTSTIYKCNTDGTVIQSFPVTQSGGADIDKLEGIAIDYANQLLYAVSDAGENLFVFTINDPTLSNESDIAKNKEAIYVYPNPVEGYLNIRITNSEQIKKVNIYSTLGKLVKTAASQIKTIDVSELQHGIYFLEITTDKNSYTKTIIIK